MCRPFRPILVLLLYLVSFFELCEEREEVSDVKRVVGGGARRGKLGIAILPDCN